MRIPVIVAILAGACVPMGTTTLQPPSRAGTTVAAPREATWNALLTVWSENAKSLGVITHTDAENGLLVASLSRTSSAAVARDLPRWGTCNSVASLTLDPDSMTWTVIVRGTEFSSTLRARALFWNPGHDCVSHGIREAELEQLVRTTAEAAGGAPRLPTREMERGGRAVLSKSGTCSPRRAEARARPASRLRTLHSIARATHPSNRAYVARRGTPSTSSTRADDAQNVRTRRAHLCVSV